MREVPRSFANDVVALIPRLKKFAIKLDHQEWEDLLQTTLVRALDKQHLFQHGTNLISWLFCIMNHEFFNKVKKAKRDPLKKALRLGEEGLDVPSSYGDADINVIVNDMVSAFTTMRAENRQAISLVCLEGKSYRRAGEIAGIPSLTLGSRVQRGREALVKAVA
jgi:RNA polymerase sigma-70 factor, ECF subfamily